MSKREARAIEIVKIGWAELVGEKELSTGVISAAIMLLLGQYGNRITISRVRDVLDKLAKSAMLLDEALGIEEGRLSNSKEKVSVSHQSPIFSIPSDD